MITVNYVFVVRHIEFVLLEQAAYQVGLVTKTGTNFQTNSILSCVPDNSELVLLQRLDSKCQGDNILRTVRAIFPRHPTCPDHLVADPWSLRSVIRCAQAGIPEPVFTERFGSSSCGDRFGYIYLVRVSDRRSNTFKVGQTRTRCLGTSISRVNSYTDREVLFVAQVNYSQTDDIEEQVIGLFARNFKCVKGREYFTGNWRAMVSFIHYVTLGPMSKPEPSLTTPEMHSVIGPIVKRLVVSHNKQAFFVPLTTMYDFFVEDPGSRSVKWSRHEATERIRNYL